MFFRKKKQEERIEDKQQIFRSDYKKYKKHRFKRETYIFNQYPETKIYKITILLRVHELQEIIISILDNINNRVILHQIKSAWLNAISIIEEDNEFFGEYKEIIPFEQKLAIYIQNTSLWYNKLHDKKYSKALSDAVKYEIWLTYQQDITEQEV